MDDKVIMYDSPEAAAPVTVTGWKSSTGQFFLDEHMARWNGCTHQTCPCGNPHKKGWTVCDTCRAKSAKEAYDKLPYKEWDEVAPVVIYGTDTYFFNVDDIADYCDNHECNSEDLMLVICTPNYLDEIDGANVWDDVLPEDGEIPDEVQNKLNELNTFIKAQSPVSWSEGSIRTSYKIPVE